jgi:hypothetical protein
LRLAAYGSNDFSITLIWPSSPDIEKRRQMVKDGHSSEHMGILNLRRKAAELDLERNSVKATEAAVMLGRLSIRGSEE